MPDIYTHHLPLHTVAPPYATFMLYTHSAQFPCPLPHAYLPTQHVHGSSLPLFYTSVLVWFDLFPIACWFPYPLPHTHPLPALPALPLPHRPTCVPCMPACLPAVLPHTQFCPHTHIAFAEDRIGTGRDYGIPFALPCTCLTACVFCPWCLYYLPATLPSPTFV